jgi:parallel beta-helix repeat protein
VLNKNGKVICGCIAMFIIKLQKRGMENHLDLKWLREMKNRIKVLIRKGIGIATLLLVIANCLMPIVSFQLAQVGAKTIIVPDDYKTIQEAINYASNGDVIFVRNGVYHEHIVVNKSVSLIGESKIATIIDGSGSRNVINITAYNVTITRLTVRNGGSLYNEGSGIFIYASYISYVNHGDYVNISQNLIINNWNGIVIYNAQNVLINDNEISSNVYNGIEISYAYNCTINKNNITKNEYGITLYGANHKVTWNNVSFNTISGIIIDSYGCEIIGNVVSNNTLDDGIILSGDNNKIINNTISSNGKYGMYIIGFNNSLLENRIFSNKEIGIFLYGSSGNIFKFNNITSNGQLGLLTNFDRNNTFICNIISTHTENGVGLFSSINNTYFQNNILNNKVGISLGTDSIGSRFVENTVKNNYVGVLVSSANNNTFYHNSFVNNTRQIYDRSWDHPWVSPSINNWDNGYPAGGNYWSDYVGSDRFYGPYQNLTGSDGIGDTPYIIDENNVDRYPLINPWPIQPRIVDIYFDKENARSFQIEIFNPLAAPSDATITRIMFGLEGEANFYDFVDTEPPIQNRILIKRGTSVNVTCFKIRMDSAIVTLGELIGSFGFAGKTVIVYVYFQEFAPVRKEIRLPFVKLYISANFDPKISFKKFEINVTNDALSEVNITITDISIIVLTIEGMDPDLQKGPVVIPPGKSVCFRFNGSWYGIVKTTVGILTEQGYIFREMVETQGNIFIVIQAISFDEKHKDHFNVTLFSMAESATYANVTKIICVFKNGTTIERSYPSVGIMPNSAITLKFDWNWTGYEGEIIEVKAYFLQDFETTPFSVQVIPEIPSITFLVLFMIASILLALHKRKKCSEKAGQF